ncbi:hypothetical protein [Microbacterium allomyrinae]|uniref:Uncharacterized protein n=1 Tax=Microbacterium allomyrinae TaxID=2830666 RepID=A0A9X1LV11_9MICO|nr:hypothetical protein [Microbacterium allomyrinae]MCC2032196.1 hypothetical protein [Microbacterium allomyrinae]
MTGRISLLVSRDLSTLIQAAQSLDREVAAQNRRHTRANVEPMWREEITHRTGTRLQTRVLVDTARVSVTDTNVTLKSAHISKVHGTPADLLKGGAEFGANENKVITVKRKGRTYRRRLGNAFGGPRRAGNVFHPAAYAFIPRASSLWMQTTYRTVAETFEKAGA